MAMALRNELRVKISLVVIHGCHPSSNGCSYSLRLQIELKQALEILRCLDTFLSLFYRHNVWSSHAKITSTTIKHEADLPG